MTSSPQNYDLNCLICLTYAQDAVVTDCCNKLMCQYCYQKVKTGNCPYCRRNPYSISIQNFARKLVFNSCPEIQFFVKSLDGKTYTMRYKQLDKIKVIKQRYQQFEQIIIESIYFTFNGRPLSDMNKTLRDYDIKDNSTIHAIGRMKGGLISDN